MDCGKFLLGILSSLLSDPNVPNRGSWHPPALPVLNLTCRREPTKGVRPIGVRSKLAIAPKEECARSEPSATLLPSRPGRGADSSRNHLATLVAEPYSPYWQQRRRRPAEPDPMNVLSRRQWGMPQDLRYLMAGNCPPHLRCSPDWCQGQWIHSLIVVSVGVHWLQEPRQTEGRCQMRLLAEPACPTAADYGC